MTATERLLESFHRGVRSLRVLSASGQLGYGIPADTLEAATRRCPDFIGCDMGSIDPGPAYLGSGRMATSQATTKRDLKLVLTAARRLDVPLIIGSAGTAGAAPHLEATLSMIREIARENSLSFRLAAIGADLAKSLVQKALEEGNLTPLGSIQQVTGQDIAQSSHIVGQMGTEAFVRACETGADVIVAGRSCDTAVFAALPKMLGYDTGLVMQMAKIIECASICCNPGGRDPILALLDTDSFVLESMHPGRHATPMSVAAHALYEQENPFEVHEPEGVLRIDEARYEAVDEHRTRVSGGRWIASVQPSVKVEAAMRVGERAVLLAATAEPGLVGRLDEAVAEVESTVRKLIPGDYSLVVRRYGLDGVVSWPTPPDSLPREVFLLAEVIADSDEQAKAAIATFKQYLLHYGFPGRLSTGGNLAFPFTPPEVDAGSAWRFTCYHSMTVDSLVSLFPVVVEEI